MIRPNAARVLAQRIIEAARENEPATAIEIAYAATIIMKGCEKDERAQGKPVTKLSGGTVISWPAA